MSDDPKLATDSMVAVMTKDRGLKKEGQVIDAFPARMIDGKAEAWINGQWITGEGKLWRKEFLLIYRKGETVRQWNDKIANAAEGHPIYSFEKYFTAEQIKEIQDDKKQTAFQENKPVCNEPYDKIRLVAELDIRDIG